MHALPTCVSFTNYMCSWKWHLGYVVFIIISSTIIITTTIIINNYYGNKMDPVIIKLKEKT